MATPEPPESQPVPITAKAPSEPVAQPKISQKLILRTAMLLFALAALFFGFRYMQDRHGDFDRGSSGSVGLLAAIQYKGDGAEAVLLKSGSEPVGTKSWTATTTDRDLAWRPDGKFLYFCSDRKDKSFHIFRWNPDSDDAQIRSIGERARSSLSFPADAVEDANDDLLMICGGTVQSFEDRTQRTPQLLPPSSANITSSTSEEGAGSEAQFQALYGDLGTSFKYARWCKGNRFIAAIMEREGGGETLIVQGMSLVDGKTPRPFPLVAGDHIDFDVNPKDGNVVFSVQGFKFPDPKVVPPEFIKNHKVVLPFRHVLGQFDPTVPGSIMFIARANDDKACFGSVAVNPDGASVLVSVGGYDGSTQSMLPSGLFSMPMKQDGFLGSAMIVKGEVYEPAWSPDGSKLAYAMRVNGHRDIYTMGRDGSALTNLTSGKGNFGTPKFSPQVTASGTATQ